MLGASAAPLSASLRFPAAARLRSLSPSLGSSLRLLSGTAPPNLSSMHEPQQSLTHPLRSMDRDAILRSDVRTLGTTLGETISSTAGPTVFSVVEELRSHTKAWREGSAPLSPAVDLAGRLTPAELLETNRSFAHFLRLANIAELNHRIRNLEQAKGARYPLPDKVDSSVGVLRDLVKRGVTPAEIIQDLREQKAQIIFTAHP
jgi:phosphoenolpyruvate carboxylase